MENNSKYMATTSQDERSGYSSFEKGVLRKIFRNISRLFKSTSDHAQSLYVKCTKFALIELANVYDSAYCKYHNGKKETEAEIVTVSVPFLYLYE